MKNKSDVYVKQMGLGPMENFIYFLGDATAKEIAVIDPAWDVDFLRSEAQKANLTITAIFLTHGHPDHVQGIPDLQSTHDVPVYISEHEHPALMPKCQNLKKVKPNDILMIGNLEIKCLHTPGHSPGCQCFWVGNTFIAGDTIFIDGCGRCDLPGSDPKKMYHSLYDVVMKLPDDVVIYPGHNYGPTPCATIGEQKESNPYLQCANIQEFLVNRMGISY